MCIRYKMCHFINSGIGYDVYIVLSATGEIFLNLISVHTSYTYPIIEVPQSLIDTIKKEAGVYSNNGAN